MTGDEFEQTQWRLANWARAVGGRVNPQQHCRSAEHRFRPEDWETRRQPRNPPDYADAYLVEAAWRRLLDPQAKWFLKWHYITGYPKHITTARMKRKFGGTFRCDYDWNRMLWRAVAAIFDQLDARRAA